MNKVILTDLSTNFHGCLTYQFHELFLKSRVDNLLQWFHLSRSNFPICLNCTCTQAKPSWLPVRAFILLLGIGLAFLPYLLDWVFVLYTCLKTWIIFRFYKHSHTHTHTKHVHLFYNMYEDSQGDKASVFIDTALAVATKCQYKCTVHNACINIIE